MKNKIHISRIISLNIIATFLLPVIFISHKLYAESCDSYKEEITYYENLRRNGGNAEEMRHWTAIGHELDDKYYHCRQDSKVVIQTTADNKSEPVHVPTYQAYEPLRRVSLKDDAQLQRLTNTCNYWIGVTNESPSQDASNFRETACSAVDNYGYTERSSNSPTDALPLRKLKECIKPHNLVDYEVNECVKGNIDPYWQKNAKRE